MPPGPLAGSPQACPETKSILGFDIVEGFRRVIDGSLSFVFSSSHLTSSHGRLFRNAHHPGRCADAACGGLEPPPARATPGGLPPSPTWHHFRSSYLHRINPPCSWRNYCRPTTFVEVFGERPFQACPLSPPHIVVDGRQRHLQRGADLAPAEPLGEGQTEDVSDLAHGGTGSGHRRLLERLLVLFEQDAEASSAHVSATPVASSPGRTNTPESVIGFDRNG